MKKKKPSKTKATTRRRQGQESLPTPCFECARMELHCCHYSYFPPAGQPCRGFVALGNQQEHPRNVLRIMIEDKNR